MNHHVPVCCFCSPRTSSAQGFLTCWAPEQSHGAISCLSQTGLNHLCGCCWVPTLAPDRGWTRGQTVWDNSSQNQPLLFVISSQGSARFCSFWPSSLAPNSPDFSTSVFPELTLYSRTSPWFITTPPQSGYFPFALCRLYCRDQFAFSNIPAHCGQLSTELTQALELKVCAQTTNSTTWANSYFKMGTTRFFRPCQSVFTTITASPLITALQTSSSCPALSSLDSSVTPFGCFLLVVKEIMATFSLCLTHDHQFSAKIKTQFWFTWNHQYQTMFCKVRQSDKYFTRYKRFLMFRKTNDWKLTL